MSGNSVNLSIRPCQGIVIFMVFVHRCSKLYGLVLMLRVVILGRVVMLRGEVLGRVIMPRVEGVFLLHTCVCMRVRVFYFIFGTFWRDLSWGPKVVFSNGAYWRSVDG